MKKLLALTLTALMIATLCLGLASCHKHEWGEDVIITEATVFSDGSAKHTCACGEEETVTIPAIGVEKLKADLSKGYWIHVGDMIDEKWTFSADGTCNLRVTAKYNGATMDLDNPTTYVIEDGVIVTTRVENGFVMELNYTYVNGVLHLDRGEDNVFTHR